MVLNNLIFNTLKNDSVLTALIGTFKTEPAIFYDLIIPSTCETKKTINFYIVEPKDGFSEINREAYNVNCRAESFYDANQIALRVNTLLNRVYPDDNSYSSCRILPGINPQDESDVYNVPVFCRIHNRS